MCQNFTKPRDMKLENVKKIPWFHPLFAGLYIKYTKNGRRHPKYCTCRLPRETIIMYQNKNGDSFTKQRFQSVQNVVQVHQILRLPRKFDPPLPALEQRALGTAPVTRMKQCPMPCTCHAKQGSDPPPKVTKLLRLPRNMHIAPKKNKKDTARSMQARTHLCNTSLQEHVSCETSFEKRRIEELLYCKGHQKGEPV